MATLYFAKTRDNTIGPFTLEQLYSMVQRGEILMETPVRRDGENGWQTLAYLRNDSSSVLPPPLPGMEQVVASNANSPMFSIRGVQDLLEVYHSKLTITPKGFMGFMNKGLKGAKTFPLSQITAIQFRKAGPFLNGYLQLTIAGSNESRRGLLAATKDENSFMFRLGDNEKMSQIAQHIEARLNCGSGSPPPLLGLTKSEGLVHELTKLAELRAAGVLSEEEFTAAKRRLIGA